MRSKELRDEWDRYYMAGQEQIQKEKRAVQEDPDRPWGVYDSKLFSYEVTFRRVMPLPHLIELAEIIKLQQEHELGASTFIGLEIMGPGSQLFGAFPDGLFTHTAGITLYDHRTPMQKEQDNARNHTVHAMNVLEESSAFDSFRKQWIGDKYVDLLICRPYQGLHGLPPHPFNQYRLYNNLYQLLGKGGEALIQYSEEHLEAAWNSPITELMSQWQTYVQDNFDIELGIDTERRALRLWKGFEAPDTLPALPAKKTLQLIR